MSGRAKDGNVILRSVNVPGQVEPGQTFEIEVEVSNGAAYIGVFEGDKCGTVPPGYKIEVSAGVGSTDQSKQDCLTTAEIGTRDNTYRFTTRAPEEPGTYRAEANVRLRSSGQTTGVVTERFEVSSSKAAEPTPTADNGNGGDGDSSVNLFDGGSSPSPNPFPEIPTKGLLVLGGLLALAWLADSAEGVIG